MSQENRFSRFVAALQHCYMHAQMHACTDALLHGCTAARMHCSMDALQHGCTATWMHCCMDAQMHCCTDALLHGCTAAQMHCCTDALLHRCTAARFLFSSFVYWVWQKIVNFCQFLSLGRIQTLGLHIVSQMFYHYASSQTN